jgi:hypothetical protein
LGLQGLSSFVREDLFINWRLRPSLRVQGQSGEGEEGRISRCGKGSVTRKVGLRRYVSLASLPLQEIMILYVEIGLRCFEEVRRLRSGAETRLTGSPEGARLFIAHMP